MDSAATTDVGYLGETERRREGRLTSIIDQLLSNRTTRSFDDAVKPDKRIKDNRLKNENGVADAIATKPSLSSNKARRKKMSRNSSSAPSSDVKRERCSPDPEIGTESSRSASPYSPNSSSLRTTNTPDRFSPANQQNNNNNKLQMSDGLHTSRSYSDFMRCLASKYNNSNPNEYRTNNLISLLDTRSSSFGGEGSSSSALTPSSSFFPLLNLPLASSFSGRKEARLTPTESGSGGKKERKDDFSMTPTTLPLCGLMQEANSNIHPPQLASGFFSSPNMDMSSTQALLNIVRSASARNNQQQQQQQQLDTYLSPAASSLSSSLKRPAAEMTMALTSHTPLDLSASMVKRPYVLEQPQGEGRNQRLREHPSSRSPAVVESDNLLLVKDNQYSPIGSSRQSSRFLTDVITACYTNQAAEKNKATTEKVAVGQLPASCRLSCAAHACSPTAAEVRQWSIAHVVDFVKSIDLCTEYAQTFQEHSIDGSTLPLLTEEHLTTNMNMKLGPALKLRSTLAKKIGHCAICLHCVHCHGDPAANNSKRQTPSSSQEQQELSTP